MPCWRVSLQKIGFRPNFLSPSNSPWYYWSMKKWQMWALKRGVISFLIIKVLVECVTAPFKLHLFAFYFSKSHRVNLSPSAVLSSHLNTSKKLGAAAETRSNRMSRDTGFLSWQVAWSFLCQSHQPRVISNTDRCEKGVITAVFAGNFTHANFYFKFSNKMGKLGHVNGPPQLSKKDLVQALTIILRKRWGVLRYNYKEAFVYKMILTQSHKIF